MKKTNLAATILFICAFALSIRAQNDYYFPKGTAFDSRIPTPEQFLGYPIGEWHTRHDRLVAYFEKLASVSEKAQFQIIGYTSELRPQVVLTISDPANLQRLETIRQDHLRLAQPYIRTGDLSNSPVIIQLGYGVHGNEASSAEAAMLTAFYLLASQSPETAGFLKNAVIHIDPVYNPDGRDRHTWWVNMHKGSPSVSDPLDREHNEVWPSGRTNHYWFDLNRDWLPLVHVESRNRVAFYHNWLPNVATDYHEMGTNATYFFEPTEPFDTENPLVPRQNYRELNTLFASYFQKALDEIGSLYYNKESFDNYYPGYGSTYPDMQGGLGLLFEQARSAGHRQQTSTEDLTFAFTIRNQVRTGIATVRAAVENGVKLLEYQRSFFQTAIEEAGKQKTKAWLFGCPDDKSRTRAFLELLQGHHIEVRHLQNAVSQNGKTFQPGDYFVVPATQPQYRLAHSIFEPKINAAIVDSVFYDASAWTVALAFDMPYERLSSLPALGNEVNPGEMKPDRQALEQASYAYLIDWSDYAAPAALNFLLENEVHVKTAFKPCVVQTGRGKKSFGYGTLLVSVADQKHPPARLWELMEQVAEVSSASIYAVSTGLSLEGIDPGSRNFETVEKPKAIMPVGEGVSGYEAGEVWHLLDTRVDMPVTKVDLLDFDNVDLYEYNTLLLVSGTYKWDDKTISKIKDWISAGNTLITSRTATKWAIEKKLVIEKLRMEESAKDTLSLPKRQDFATANDQLGSRRIGGVIFPADVDPTHPLGFGFTDRQLPVYRNHEVFVEPSRNAFSTPVRYTDAPQLDGYVHRDNLKMVQNSASLLASKVGRGRAILFVDNPNFRGFWYGTNRLFFNALFFGSLVSVPER
jgi:hypothetical protein